jgi:hypothetical protein
LLIGHDSILYDPLELTPDLREAVALHRRAYERKTRGRTRLSAAGVYNPLTTFGQC